jgi:hypothetical protein
MKKDIIEFTKPTIEKAKSKGIIGKSVMIKKKNKV